MDERQWDEAAEQVGEKIRMHAHEGQDVSEMRADDGGFEMARWKVGLVFGVILMAPLFVFALQFSGVGGGEGREAAGQGLVATVGQFVRERDASEPVPDGELERAAAFYVSQLLTYSNRDNYANLLGLRDEVTAQRWAEIEDVIRESEAAPEEQLEFAWSRFEVDVVELVARETEEDEAVARVWVEGERQQYRDEEIVDGREAWQVLMRYESGDWRVDEARLVE